MLKYENVANIGDTIKGFDFEPMPGREDAFLIGKVVDKGMIKHPVEGFDMYKAYTVEIVGGDDHWKGRIGETAYVPFESTFDYDGRVSRVAIREEHQEDRECDDELANIGARIIASAAWKSCNTKKAAAQMIFNDFGHNGRKFVTELFVEILGMSKAGANTYFYNCKKAA